MRIVESPIQANKHMTTVSSSLTPLTILVAEDDLEESRAIQQWLESRGYLVLLTPDAVHVLNALQSITPALLLLKNKLPIKSGVELCCLIKADERFDFLPLILITDGDPEETQVCLEAGADDVLSRPLDKNILLARIGLLLRLKQRYDDLWQRNQTLAEELEKHKHDTARTLREAREIVLLKDSIVQNVSHELRTPLLQLKSSVAMLAEDARAGSANGLSVLADYATAATARLESVVQNITQLAASLDVKVEPFRLIDAVNLATRQLSRQWSSSSGVDRILPLVNDAPPILGDRAGVAQVLKQLLDNALKFSPNGKPVEITVERCDGSLRIAVRDQGIGIADDQMERIFQAFYQVDSSVTRPFGGTGVGLAIVKLLLDAMNSTIEVHSEPSVGSTFSFLLPITDSPI
ncbi:MAG: ATP-binding protein [Chloroflexota bacterium]